MSVHNKRLPINVPFPCPFYSCQAQSSNTSESKEHTHRSPATQRQHIYLSHPAKRRVYPPRGEPPGTEGHTYVYLCGRQPSIHDDLASIDKAIRRKEQRCGCDLLRCSESAERCRGEHIGNSIGGHFYNSRKSIQSERRMRAWGADCQSCQ